MKKYLAFCLSALLILSLTTGCGSPAEEAESSVPESSQSEVSRTESSEESSEEESQESSESSVESTPDPDPSSESSTVPAGSDVGASFFDDAVFIGDSISLRLTMYCQANPDALGKAQFLTAGSLGSGNALWDENSQDAVFPTYNGQVVTLQDGVQKSGAKKVFIMLGMNDVGLYGVEGARDNMETLIGLILEKSPNVTIYVQSMTPMLTTHQLKSLNNPNIEAYNKLLREMCAEHGWNFVDVASVMKESDGGLIPAYCSDGGDGGMGMHFTNEGAVAWVNYLRTHVS